MSIPVKQSFFGWHVVSATFILAVFGWGVGFYGPPVFLQIVVQRTGWPMALVSAAVTVHFLAGAVVVANLPRLYKKLTVPVVTSTGAAFLSLGIIGWSIANHPLFLFAAAVLSGIGWVGMGAAAVNAIIAPWFVRSRPAALSMAYNGASIGGVVFSPLWVVLIVSMGFTFAAITVSAVMVFIVITLSAMVFSKTPEQLNQAPDGDNIDLAVNVQAIEKSNPPLQSTAPKNLWKSRHFVTLSAGMALGLFAQIGLIAHLFSIFTPVMGAQKTGLIMGGATIFAIIGRTLTGWIMPVSANRRMIAAASYTVQIIGSVALILSGAENSGLMIAGALIFGLGIGNATSLPPLIAQHEFTKTDAARAVPLIVAISQASYAFAPAIFGMLRSLSDTTVFIAATIIQCAAIGAFLSGAAKLRQKPANISA